ncbi:hypothetical protein [Rhizobium sp. 1399]|uniref:hypothetical protein n=1 Tax=Rhizobium sp. 1399 TaxID=2817758 RepID=UPI00285476A9|nr:hypothetical protein [Rhizobium sp. 1399]MDR6664013.1 hypothetical protein [Rhizobium sp. 1399]
MIFRHIRKLRRIDLKPLENVTSRTVREDQSRTDWEKIGAIGTIAGAAATLAVGLGAIGVYLYQANIAEKGLIEPYRVPSYVAIMQKLDSICSDFDHVYPGVVISSSENGTILVKETLSDMPLKQFIAFQKRIQAKADPLMADAAIHAGVSGNSREREIFMGLAGELERYSFQRTGIPDRYQDGQVWIATFARDCRSTWYSLLGALGGNFREKPYPGDVRVLSMAELRKLEPTVSEWITDRQMTPRPAFPQDMLPPEAGAGGP